MSSPVSQNLRAAVCIASVLFPIACKDSTAPPPTAVQLIVAPLLSTPVAGDQVVVTAQLADADGKPVKISGRTISWVSDRVVTRFDPISSLTGPDGSASTLFRTDTVAGIRHAVGAIDGAHSIQGTTTGILTVAGLPTTYTVQSNIPNPEVGSSVIISAQLGDRYNNPLKIAGRVVEWTHATSGGSTDASFSSPTSTTNADGIATVNFTIGAQSGVSYQVSARDQQQAGGVSYAFVSRAGAFAAYSVYPSVIDPPAGAAVLVYAQATDAHGNFAPERDRVVQWTMTGSGGSLDATTSRTDGGGLATVTLMTAATPGATYTVSASDNGKGGTSPSITTTQQVSLASLAGGLGLTSSCGIATDGKAWCWGANDSGELGNGNTIERAFPGRVAGNYTMTSLSAGVSHTCGIAGGVVLCWGNNGNGQLGDNSFASRLVPTPINSSASFTSVSAGGTHTCAIAAGGDAYCWGSAASGRLGDGNQTNNFPSPVKVAGSLSFASLSAGVDHTCGITTSGDAYCWGSNTFGKLGNNSVAPAFSPQAVTGGLKFTSIGVGENHTCGISGGKAYCWGDHSYGQLGIGSPSSFKTAPVAVAGGLNFAAISVGGFHTCGIATDTKAYCWGDNSNSELGDADLPSSISYSSVPMPVSGGLSFSSIAVGGGMMSVDDYYYYYYYYGAPGGHSCGVTTSGVAYCWGSNSRGELGSGPSLAISRAPIKVLGQP